VSTGFLAVVRQCRRPLIAVAIALVVLQTFVAGLAAAQSASFLKPFESGVICHGAGGAEPASDPASDSHKAPCCLFCAATVPALLPVTPPVTGHIERTAVGRVPAVSHDFVLIVRRAVRAGPSQAPPSLS
jgi:hypothetical protein